jgi:hypothetical protein
MSPGLRYPLALLACLVAASAYGQADRHFFVGASIGQSKLDRSHVFGNPVQSSDDESETWSLAVGYRFNRYFTLEGGYSDLGSYEVTYEGLCLASLPPICGGPVPARTETDGFFANAIGTWPVTSHFQLSANIGMVYREVQFRATASGDNMWSTEGTVWKLGVGAGFPINDRLEITLDVSQYLDLGLDLVTPIGGTPHTVDSGDATAVTVGARWVF